MSLVGLIKESVPIVEALERYTTADFTNSNTTRKKFNIRCPFHNDSSPSFTIFNDNNTCRCWAGCTNHRSIDVIDLVALSQGISTKQSISLLAKDFNINTTNKARMSELKAKKQKLILSNQSKRTIREGVSRAITNLKQMSFFIDVRFTQCTNMLEVESLSELRDFQSLIECWLDYLVYFNDDQLKLDVLKEIKTKLDEIKKEGKRHG